MILAAGNTPEQSSVANFLPTALINRCIVLTVSPPRVDAWADFMDKMYPMQWDKRVYAFLKRFEAENYLLQMPRETETLQNFATPRTWTDLALLLAKGIENDDVITGLLGYEIGQKFEAFLKVNLDIRELRKEPAKFHSLSLDAKYMACVMLASWLTRSTKKWKMSFPLIDTMSKESKDFLVLTCMSMKKNRLTEYLKELFRYNQEYMTILDTVVLKLKRELVAN